jgi:hypothetical protein
MEPPLFNSKLAITYFDLCKYFYNILIKCPKLDNYRVTLINELSDIVSSFKHLNNEAKLKKIFTCEEYDIVKIILMKISEMYNIRFDLIK